MVGPLLHLRLSGFFCPWLEDGNEHESRVAAFSLQSIPIRLYTKVRKRQRSEEGAMGDFVTGLLGDESTVYVPANATLSVIDTPLGPAVEISSSEIIQHGECQFKDDASTNSIKQSEWCHANDCATANGEQANRILIPLEKIETAARGNGWEGIGTGRCDCDVKIYGPPTEDQLIGSGKKLLQFDVLGQESSFHRLGPDDLIAHLNIMLNWNRARLAKEQERFSFCAGCGPWLAAANDYHDDEIEKSIPQEERFTHSRHGAQVASV